MSTRRVSITGIDGTGKTTIIRELARRHASEPSAFQAFRAPQFHESPGVPHAALSADIDALSVLADRLGDPVLKAVSLLLSMTLYGGVERHFEKTFHPALLIGERQPLLDSLVYSLFYAKLLTRPLDRVKLMPELERAIGAGGLERLGAWMGRLSARDPGIGSGLESFWSLPLYAKALFARPAPDLLKALRALYEASEPHEIIVLEVSGDPLRDRLRQKRSGGTEVELHERRSALEQLQNGVRSALVPLKAFYPDTRVHQLDTSALSVEEACDRILSLVQGNPSRLR